MTELTDWRRAVTVDWVRNNSLNTVQGYGSGTVRIIVRVEVGGVQLASLMAVKTGAASIRTLDVRESLPSKDPIIIDPLPLD